MTWGEFKEKVDREVNDDEELWTIDLTGWLNDELQIAHNKDLGVEIYAG